MNVIINAPSTQKLIHYIKKKKKKPNGIPEENE